MQNFSGCYILRSQNSRHRNACYIGFTIDPLHRLKQHNGEITGGAVKTHSKRPWEMVLVVWGFPTNKLALKFEWCWQHPTESKSLKNINFNELFGSTHSPTKFPAKILVLKEMLRSKPWCRLSLKLCVQSEDIYKDLINSHLQDIVQLTLGNIRDLPVEGVRLPTPGRSVPSYCKLCKGKELSIRSNNWFICMFCGTFLHIRCVTNHFISQSSQSTTELIPTRGYCPVCKESMLWRDIIDMMNKAPINVDKDNIILEKYDF